MQMLSVTSPSVSVSVSAQFEAATLARRVNDEIAEIAARYRDRFAAAAVLPLPDVGVSLEAIDYCFAVLDVCAVTLFTNYAGRYLGDALFRTGLR